MNHISSNNASSFTVEDWLKKNNFPYSDNIEKKYSKKSFCDDALFGVEIPVINSFSVLEKTLYWLNQYETPCTRFNETKGSFLLPENEIKDMLSLCKENNVGMVFALSPRPEYDTKASFYRSNFGLEQCRRLNNNNAVAASLDEAMRLAELGCKGIIVYDAGVLFLLNKMRKDGLLPEDMFFKASSHCMVTNPFIANLYYQNGSNSVTMLHDVGLSVIQETRRLVPNLILDVPIDTYSDKGGFVRFNEIADIVLCGAPTFLKIGAGTQTNPYDIVPESVIQSRVKRACVAIEHLKRAIPDAKIVGQSENCCCIPSICTPSHNKALCTKEEV